MSASWAVFLSAAVLPAIAVGSIAFFVLRRQLRRIENMHRASKERLVQELKSQGKALRQTIERLGSTERRVREATERQNRLEMMAPSTERFRHAIALVQRGAGTEELMTTCGLARGEAELLYLLHRSGATPRDLDTLT